MKYRLLYFTKFESDLYETSNCCYIQSASYGLVTMENLFVYPQTNHANREFYCKPCVYRALSALLHRGSFSGEMAKNGETGEKTGTVKTGAVGVRWVGGKPLQRMNATCVRNMTKFDAGELLGNSGKKVKR